MSNIRPVMVDGKKYPAMRDAAQAIGIGPKYLWAVLAKGQGSVKGRKVSYAPMEAEKKAAAPQRGPGKGRGTPVFIDGRRFSSKLAACIELECEDYDLRRALDGDGMLLGRRVSLTPDSPTVLHHRIPVAIMQRRKGSPLIVEPVTHRLGVYSGGPA